MWDGRAAAAINMKVAGNGQAKILTSSELVHLFRDGFVGDRDRCLFAIALFTGCRISEALALHIDDVKGGTITFRKASTKGRSRTRIIEINPQLEPFLLAYQPRRKIWLFPGRLPSRPLSRHTADEILRAACRKINLEGISTHSFRRTALTLMSSAGVPLRVIQEISGHQSLATLQRYLEVTPEQRRSAVSAISF